MRAGEARAPGWQMRDADLQARRLVHVLVQRLRSGDQLEGRRVVGQHLREADGDPVDRLPGTYLDGEQSQLAAGTDLAVSTRRVTRSRLLRVVEQRVELVRGIDEGADLVAATGAHLRERERGRERSRVWRVPEKPGLGHPRHRRGPAAIAVRRRERPGVEQQQDRIAARWATVRDLAADDARRGTKSAVAGVLVEPGGDARLPASEDTDRECRKDAPDRQNAPAAVRSTRRPIWFPNGCSRCSSPSRL